MSSYCTMCGSPVPEGQRTCSMCYGDIDHGKDGYYRQWAEQEMTESLARKAWNELQIKEKENASR